MIEYEVKYSSSFKKQLKRIIKRGKDTSKLLDVIDKLSKGIKLDSKYKDHALIDNKYFKSCRECHIEPDWLLVYKYSKNDILLILIQTGSHSDLFNM